MPTIRTRGLALAAFILALTGAGCAPEAPHHQAMALQRTSFVYAEDGESGTLDRIVAGAVEAGERQPALIILPDDPGQIGGRYSGGLTRFARHFAARGYTVIAVSYAKPSEAPTAPEESLGWLPGSQRPARRSVEDLFNATAFVLGRAETWNIDPRRIVVVGSGDGADLALAAEYFLAQQTPAARRHLPADFRYAGVIAMGGGLPSQQATSRPWRSAPSPILHFSAGATGETTRTGEDLGAPSGASAFYALSEANGYALRLIEVSGDPDRAAHAPLISYAPVEAFLNQAFDGAGRQRLREPLKIGWLGYTLAFLRAETMARLNPIS